MASDQLYCGCCGNEIGRSTRGDPDWCGRCKPHAGRRAPYDRHPDPNAPAWERTYFAIHGVPCPYQVGAP